MAASTVTEGPAQADLPAIARLPGDAHWGWLRRGWVDFMTGWKASLYVGLAVFFVSVGLVSLLWNIGYGPLVPVAVGAFIIGGPALAVSVYGVSARVEKGEVITGPGQLFARMASPGQVAFIGFCLFIIVFVWARLAFLLYALFSGQTTIHNGAEAVAWMLGTVEGLSMMVLGTAIGAALATLAFAVAMISVPLVANRKIDAMTAMVLSVLAVRRNLMASLGWAFVIVMLMAISVVLFLIPIAFVFPWLGHATWHAYRDLVQDRPAL
ncbi:MAG: DUF2189 domain-containing protein [Hyphomonadaceae bacterium]|nr:DUF2189 domain-containing protein [Hyphomonadaceae bacterium]